MFVSMVEFGTEEEILGTYEHLQNAKDAIERIVLEESSRLEDNLNTENPSLYGESANFYIKNGNNSILIYDDEVGWNEISGW